MTQTISLLQRTKLNEALAKTRKQLFKVPDRRPVSVWAQENLRMSTADTAASGPLRFTDHNFQMAVLDAINEPGVEKVIIKAAAQTLKTQTIIIYLSWLIQNSPGPVLIVTAGENLASQTRGRIKNHIDANPELKRCFIGKSYRKFVGGEVSVVTGRSTSALASRSIKYLFIDETDRVTHNAEGSIVDQADARTRMYADIGRKIIIVSSPTGDGSKSVICREYDASSKGIYMVPCHNCGHEQELEFKQVQAPEVINPRDGKSKDLERTYYECIACQREWDNNEKKANVRRGNWVHFEPNNKIRGFAINSINSPKLSLKECLFKWFKACKEDQGSEENKLTFYNTILNRTYRDVTQDVGELPLGDRRKPLPQHCIPNEIVLITCGVDVGESPGGLWYVVKGYGRHAQGFTLEKGTFSGDPRANAVWDELRHELFAKVYTREDGQGLRIHSFGIDIAPYWEETKRFARKYRRRNVFAVRGQGKFDVSLWPNQLIRSGKHKHGGYMIGEAAAKERLYQQFFIDDPSKPGYQHFSDSLDDDFFTELQGEIIVTERGKKRWQKIAHLQRVEALDCTAYADCVRHAYGVNLEDRYDQLLEEGKRLAVLAEEKAKSDPTGKPENIAPKRQRATSRPISIWKQ